MRKGPGWFVNRSPNITLNVHTVQAGEIPGPAESPDLPHQVHPGAAHLAHLARLARRL